MVMVAAAFITTAMVTTSALKIFWKKVRCRRKKRWRGTQLTVIEAIGSPVTIREPTP
jgi:hypothetical protein